MNFIYFTGLAPNLMSFTQMCMFCRSTLKN